jgi:diguanylate cyclase
VLNRSAVIERATNMLRSKRAAMAVLDIDSPVDRRVTASFGVSNNEARTGFDTAYGLADAALYRAKRSGRNRVKFADQ